MCILRRILLAVFVAAAAASPSAPSFAIVGTSISNLSYTPLPRNPIRIWGKVVSESPLRITDGQVAAEVVGVTGKIGDFLIVDGDWNGTSLTVTGSASMFTSAPRIHMVWIPAGSFLMGNTWSGDDIYPYYMPDELPQHSVDLPGYWIGRYEITRGEYRQFIDHGGYSNPAYWSEEAWSWRVSMGWTHPYYWDAVQEWGTGSFTQTEDDPVVGVTYYETEAFCNWAGAHLPSEEQWEKAARWDGHPRIYPWGDTWDKEKCNNYDDTNPLGGGYGKFQTSPVGSYPSGASPYGCMDMAGNVREYIQGYYVSYPGSSDPFYYPYRVLRGGSWYYGYGEAGFGYRCAFRGGWTVDDSSISYSQGFRIVR